MPHGNLSAGIRGIKACQFNLEVVIPYLSDYNTNLRQGSVSVCRILRSVSAKFYSIVVLLLGRMHWTLIEGNQTEIPIKPKIEITTDYYWAANTTQEKETSFIKGFQNAWYSEYILSFSWYLTMRVAGYLR